MTADWTWTPNVGDRVRFVGSNGPLKHGTTGTVDRGPTGKSGRWRIVADGGSWGDWTPKQLRTVWRPIRTEPGQAHKPMTFENVVLEVNGERIRASEVKWEPDRPDAGRIRVNAETGNVELSESGGPWKPMAKPGRAPITLLGDPGEPNVYLNGKLQRNGIDVHALNDEGAPVFDPTILVPIGDRAQVNYSNGLQEFYARVNPGRWKLAGDRRAPRPPEVIQLNAEFRDANGDRVELGSPVQCDIRTPSGNVLTYTTTSGQVRERSQGNYTLQFTAQEPGAYRVRWAGPEAKLETEVTVTGTGGASEHHAAVEPPDPQWDAETRQRILDELEVDAADALRDVDAALNALDSDDPDA